jgi:hypothetical protein
VAGGVSIFSSPVTAVSRSTDKLDIFVVGTDGHVYTAAWEPDFADWHGWFPIGDAVFPLRSPVHAVSRSTDKLDIFATDIDGAILTSAWQPGFTQWRPWRQISGIIATPSSHVTAVSRSTDKLDIFVAATNTLSFTDPGGHVYTAAWEPDFGNDWGSWRPIGVLGDIESGIFAANGAPVGAVSRSTDTIDIFVSAVEFFVPDTTIIPKPLGVQTSAWQPGFADWSPWRLVAGGGNADWASPVAAVSRNTDKLDIFATDTDGTVQTAAWEPDFGSDWHGWRPA